MCENNNCYRSSDSCCTSENNFYFKVNDTLDKSSSNLNKELACQLRIINNELNVLKNIIALLVFYIMCYTKNC